MRAGATPLLRTYAGSKHAAGALCELSCASRVALISANIIYGPGLAGSETHVLAPGRATNTMAPQTSCSMVTL
jgi:hypothetical protein